MFHFKIKSTTTAVGREQEKKKKFRENQTDIKNLPTKP